MQQRRQQIGERLPRSRSGLNNDVILFLERPVNGFRHSHLRRPKLVVFQPLFEYPTRPEEILHPDSVSPAPGQMRSQFRVSSRSGNGIEQLGTPLLDETIEAL